jgi:hypothetical protein
MAHHARRAWHLSGRRRNRAAGSAIWRLSQPGSRRLRPACLHGSAHRLRRRRQPRTVVRVRARATGRSPAWEPVPGSRPVASRLPKSGWLTTSSARPLVHSSPEGGPRPRNPYDIDSCLCLASCRACYKTSASVNIDARLSLDRADPRRCCCGVRLVAAIAWSRACRGIAGSITARDARFRKAGMPVSAAVPARKQPEKRPVTPDPDRAGKD